MKVLKTAVQKNAPLATYMYAERQIENLAYQGYIFRINDDDIWRVCLSSCTDINVKYLKDAEFYQVVAKYLDGTELYITL